MKTITVSEAEYQMIVESRAAERLYAPTKAHERLDSLLDPLWSARVAGRLYDKETGWKHLERRSIDQCGQDFSFNENDFYENDFYGGGGGFSGGGSSGSW